MPGRRGARTKPRYWQVAVVETEDGVQGPQLWLAKGARHVAAYLDRKGIEAVLALCLIETGEKDCTPARLQRQRWWPKETLAIMTAGTRTARAVLLPVMSATGEIQEPASRPRVDDRVFAITLKRDHAHQGCWIDGTTRRASAYTGDAAGSALRAAAEEFLGKDGSRAAAVDKVVRIGTEEYSTKSTMSTGETELTLHQLHVMTLRKAETD